MRLLLDEMWAPSIAAELRRLGHQADAVTERPDLRGRTDRELFAIAQTENRIIVTENVEDYLELAAQAHQAGEAHCGLLFTTDRRFPRRSRSTPGRLIAALEALGRLDIELRGLEWWLSD